MYALTIWEHPVAAQPFERETVATAADEAAGNLVIIAQEAGWEYCTEVLGRYMFTKPGTRDTALIYRAR